MVRCPWHWCCTSSAWFCLSCNLLYSNWMILLTVPIDSTYSVSPSKIGRWWASPLYKPNVTKPDLRFSRRYYKNCLLWCDTLSFYGQITTLLINLLPSSSDLCAHFEDEGGRFLWNIGVYLPNCTVSHPRQPCCSYYKIKISRVRRAEER